MSALAFDAKSEKLASAAMDGMVKLWNSDQAPHPLTLNGHAVAVQSVAFSPDGERLMTGSRDGVLKVWDAANGQVTLTLEAQRGEVNALALSRDGRRLAAALPDGTAAIRDVATGAPELKSVVGSAFTALSAPGILKITAFTDTAAGTCRVRAKSVSLRG